MSEPKVVVLKFVVTEATRQALKIAAAIAGKTMTVHAMSLLRDGGIPIDPRDLDEPVPAPPRPGRRAGPRARKRS